MAYWIHESGNKNNSLWKFFQCDYLSDIEKLPTSTKDGKPQLGDTVSNSRCSSGSQCLCQEDGSMWFLGKDTDKWIQCKIQASSSLTGGLEEYIEPIPSSSIEALFS